jgi:hypothetical protein
VHSSYGMGWLWVPYLQVSEYFYVSWSERLKSSEKREERPLIMFRTLISTWKVVKELVFFWVLRKTQKNTRSFTTFPVEIYVRDTLSVDAFPFWVDFEFWPRIVFYVFQMPIFYSTCCVLKEKASFISNL